MKNKIEGLIHDLALLYLSGFEEGLDYYNWDRNILYDLKMKVSPSSVIRNLIDCGVAESVVKNNTKYFLLTDLGKRYALELKEEVKGNLKSFLSMINRLGEEFGFLNNIIIRLPYISFTYNEHRYHFVYMNNEGYFIRLFIPNDLPNIVVNEFDLSLRAIDETNYLEKILRANFSLFKDLNRPA